MSEAQQLPTVSTFASLLQQHRTAAALSQQALAERAGLSVRAISDLERGVKTRPYMETVRMLAEALGLSAEERARFAAAARPAPAVPTGQPPPPRPATAPSSNLHASYADLVARETELAAVNAALGEESARLVTLIGAGGVGKTRLAIAAASAAAGDFPGGVRWVELTALGDPGLVPAAVAQAIGIDEETRRPPTEAIRAHLQDRRFLLVIDNCEHVRGAVSALVSELLSNCPGLAVLATSRSRLRLAREQLIQVAPLSVPTANSRSVLDDVAGADAVRFFLQCARKVHPDFILTEGNAADVAAICRRLDGLPLAIELAAARLRVLAPASLRALLDERFRLLTTGFDDAPAHHRTLEAALAWSYDQLSPAGQATLQTCATFAGGCSFDSLSAASALGDPIALLTGLEELVDQSLISATNLTTGDLRYSMLDTVREYGRGKLVASGEDASVRDRHAQYFLQIAEQADGELSGPEQAAWLSRLDTDRDNLRAALDWLEQRDNQTDSLRLAASLWPYWARRGSLDEGRGWLERALVIEEADSPLRARGFHRLGNFYIDLGNYPRAREAYTRSLEIARRIDDQHAVANALNGLGIVAADTGELDQAREFHQSALEIRVALEDSSGQARSMFNLGLVSTSLGQFESAMSWFQRSMEIDQARGDIASRAYLGWAMGRVEVRQGNFSSAQTLLQRCLRVFEELGDDPGVGATEIEMGYLAYLQGEYVRALARLCRSLVMEIALEDKLGTYTCIELLAATAIRLGHPESAAVFIGAAEVLREIMGTPLPHVDAELHSSVTMACVTALGEREYAAALSEGRGMTEARLIRLAESLDS